MSELSKSFHLHNGWMGFTLRIIIILVLNCNSILGICQGSKNDSLQLTEVQINNLAILGKIWGFLKYNDPNVSGIRYDWDSVLFTKIPLFKTANTNQLNIYLASWFNELGDSGHLPVCKVELSKNEKVYQDQSWFYSSHFTQENIEKLEFIRCSTNRDSLYYAGYGNSGQIRILHERPYLSMSYPPAPYRLLALFRYWNVVQYFSPYSYLSQNKWPAVLHSFIPILYKSKDSLEYALSMMRLITQLNDGHSSLLWTKAMVRHFGIYLNMPFLCTISDGRAFVTEIFNDSLCMLDHIKKGNEIISIDGEKIADRINRFQPYSYSGPNKDAQLKAISEAFLFSGTDSVCNIKYFNGKNVVSTSIKRYSTPEPIFGNRSYKKTERSCKLLDGNIGYINMGVLQEYDVNFIMDSLINTRAIIFDLRNHPQDTWRSIAKRLTNDSYTVWKMSGPVIKFPGRFRLDDVVVGEHNNSNIYKGHVFLLVNQLTKSSGELSAMGLQAAVHSTTIGSSSAGADGDITDWIVFPGGLATRFSGLGVYYPDGSETQGKGVKIDIYFKPTIPELKSGKDVLLEKAIEVANADKKR